MIINTNMPALNAWRALSINTNNTQKALQQLSTGNRINRAADDAAGLAISEKMQAQINGLDQASRNAQDGISLIQTAEGALNETHSMLQRMRELVTQAANDTNTQQDRANIQKEITNLQDEINRLSSQTQFNTKALLDGSLSVDFQIGSNSGQFIGLTVGDMSSSALGIAAVDVSATADASIISGYLDTIDSAINTVSGERANLGAVQNRLEHTINSLGVSSDNLTAANSRIKNVDMAQAMMEFTKDNILNQAATAMLEKMAA